MQLIAERERFAHGGLQDQIIGAMAIIRQALERSRRPYIAFSGGKDSIAITALTHTVEPSVPLVWSDDELEYPETVKLMTDAQAVANGQLIVLRSVPSAPHAGWHTPWTDRPYWREPLPGSVQPTRANRDWLADEGYDLSILGTRGEESARRMAHLVEAGPTYRASTGLRCCPIWDWSADDVWALIAGWGLPYNAAYDVLDRIWVRRDKQRVGPLPLVPRQTLADGWPDVLDRLETRYGSRWG